MGVGAGILHNLFKSKGWPPFKLTSAYYMPPNYLALALYQAVALCSVKRVLCLVLSVEKTGLSPNTLFKYMMMSFLFCFLPSPKSCPIPEKQDGRSLASLSQTQPLSPKSLILCMVSGCPVSLRPDLDQKSCHSSLSQVFQHGLPHLSEESSFWVFSIT